MTDIQESLDQIKARADASTGSQWYRHSSADSSGFESHSVKSAASGQVVAFTGYGPEGGTAHADADFIAHAREDIDMLHDTLKEVLEYINDTVVYENPEDDRETGYQDAVDDSRADILRIIEKKFKGGEDQ